MPKSKKVQSQKSVKKSKKQEYKNMIAQKLGDALQDIRDHWKPKKFEARLKKAIKLFSDGKLPKLKLEKKEENK